MTNIKLHYSYNSGMLFVATTDMLLWLRGILDKEAYEKLAQAFLEAENRAEEQL